MRLSLYAFSGDFAIFPAIFLFLGDPFVHLSVAITINEFFWSRFYTLNNKKTLAFCLARVFEIDGAKGARTPDLFAARVDY